MLRETTSRGLCELVCPSRTNERGGYCVKEGGGEEGECERERAGEVQLHYSLGVVVVVVEIEVDPLRTMYDHWTRIVMPMLLPPRGRLCSSGPCRMQRV